jgi:hypothetical protein
MEERIIMVVLTAEQVVDRFPEAYDWVAQYGTDGFFNIPGGPTVDDFIADKYVFFIDVNGNLCCERDRSEFVWEPTSGEWLQGK